MNSKRVKLRVASACTAALMVGSMMASSASVFAIVGGNHPGRDNTAQESIMIQGAGAVAVQREQIARWRQELEQLKARVSELMSKSITISRQILERQEAALKKFREFENTLQAQVEKEVSDTRIVDCFNKIKSVVNGQEAIIAETQSHIINVLATYARLAETEENLWDVFRTGTNELIVAVGNLELCRHNLQERINDRELMNNLRQWEERVGERRREVQTVLESMRNFYQEVISKRESECDIAEQSLRMLEDTSAE